MKKAYQLLLRWRTLGKQLMKQHTMMTDGGTSLAVQWLRLRAANAGGKGSIPGGRTGILHAPRGSQKMKTKALWQMCTCTRPSLVKGRSAGKESAAVRVRFLGWEDPLEKGKATHSSVLAWRIPWTVQSMGSQRVRHD